MPDELKMRGGHEVVFDERTKTPKVFALKPAFQEDLTENSPGGPDEVTFSEPVTHLVILNRDVTNDGVFTVNGLPKIVPAGADIPVTPFGGTPSNTVQITGSTSFIISRFD